MKYLLLTIMYVTMMYGGRFEQTLAKTAENLGRDTTNICGRLATLPPIDTTDGKNWIPYAPQLDLLLRYYTQYEQECWDDSTKHDREDGGYWNIQHWAWNEKYGDFIQVVTDSVSWNGKHFYRWYWTHKEPTFHDFMSWLKKRREK